MGKTSAADKRSFDRLFFLSMAIWFVVASLIGFGVVSVFRLIAPSDFEPMSLAVMLHGLVFTTWIVLFLTQIVLIRQDRHAVHRRLGQWSIGLILLVLATGFYVVLEKFGTGRKSDYEAIYNLLQISSGVVLLLAGVGQRGHAFFHKRLMLGGASFLAVAAAQRAVAFTPLMAIPNAMLAAMAFPFVALAIYDIAVYRRPWLSLLLLGWWTLIHIVFVGRIIVDHLGGDVALQLLVKTLGLAI